MWPSALLALLFAEAPKDLFERSEVVWAMVGLTASLIVGAVVIYAVDKWRKRADTGPSQADEAATLTSYRAMYEAGEITEAEYAVLRQRIADRVKKPAPAPDASASGAPAPTGARPSAAQQATTEYAPAPPANPSDPPPPA